ncbi:cyclin N-terminal domain-containing protein 2 [Gadus chalcogrammus]|uniref:cyclin N-terminal domain-containing protein 2 n=1 Tax=Gadus chalcogrammus TaxID=1042646 RepID=UPI0024C47CBA|nr:cyclin N-terminal domain-containing protein 2 [Gadus chalcogrammus]
MLHPSLLPLLLKKVAAVVWGGNSWSSAVIMARTGFCDSKPLLDLHKKAEERRPALRAWANSSEPKDRRHPPEGEEPRRGQKVEPECKWERRLPVSIKEGNITGYYENDLTAWVGLSYELLYHQGLESLLRREVEKAMEKLDLTWDRACAWDMFEHMMTNQYRNTFASAELPRPFTDTTRAVLVDWLIQVHEMLHFQDETLYLAISLMNRGLRQIKVSTVNLQLLGVVCLFLAAKKEECLVPEVSELCYLMDNGYTKKQLLRMERRVLSGLQFDLSHCSPLDFLLFTASIARCSAKVVWMARYLLELSLLEGECVVYLPMQLAGAVLCLARRVLQEPPTPDGDAAWCIASIIYIGSETTLLRIMHILAGAAAKAHCQENRGTFVKYSSALTMHVSSHPVLQNASCLLPAYLKWPESLVALALHEKIAEAWVPQRLDEDLKL